jgi:hypothetical protein
MNIHAKTMCEYLALHPRAHSHCVITTCLKEWKAEIERLESDCKKWKDEIEMAYTIDGLGLVEENIKLRAELLKCEAALVDLIAGVERHTGCCKTEQLSECDLCRALINANKALKP